MNNFKKTYQRDMARASWRQSRTQRLFRTRNLIMLAILLCALGLVLHLATHLKHKPQITQKPQSVVIPVTLPKQHTTS